MQYMSITNRTVPSNNEIYSGIYWKHALHDVGDAGQALHDVGDAGHALDASLFIYF